VLFGRDLAVDGRRGKVGLRSPLPSLRCLRHRYDYLVVVASFVLSRLGAELAGLKFNPDLGWMFMADPGALREHPFQALFYFHAFPPGMNAHAALIFALTDHDFAQWAHLSLSAFALVLTLCVLYLAKALGLSRPVGTFVAVAFSLYPATFFLENVFLYTVPSAALLATSAVLLHRSLSRRSRLSWMAFFGVCAILGVYRSTYHLVWFFLVLLVSVAVAGRGSRKHVLLSGLLPACALCSLYVKNWVVFGVFGLTSWGGANLVAVTTRQMPPAERNAWVDQGRLSPLAKISTFAPPTAYSRLVRTQRYPWPGTNELVKPSSGAPNYNHGLFLGVNRRRGQDSSYYIFNRPIDYLRTVFLVGLPQYFEPTTMWHPADDNPRSAHWQHHRIFSPVEPTFNRLLHEPVSALAPFGWYALLPLVLIWAVWDAVLGLRLGSTSSRRARSVLLLFLTSQILFSAAISCAFALGENSRYRYLVEAFIWALGAACLASLLRKLWPARFGNVSRATHLPSRPVTKA